MSMQSEALYTSDLPAYPPSEQSLCLYNVHPQLFCSSTCSQSPYRVLSPHHISYRFLFPRPLLMAKQPLPWLDPLKRFFVDVSTIFGSGPAPAQFDVFYIYIFFYSAAVPILADFLCTKSVYSLTKTAGWFSSSFLRYIWSLPTVLYYLSPFMCPTRCQISSSLS